MIYSKKGVGYQQVAYFLSILPSFILYSDTVLNELDMLGIGIHKLVSTASMYRINEVQEHYALQLHKDWINNTMAYIDEGSKSEQTPLDKKNPLGMERP